MSVEQDSELRADFVNESRDLLQRLGEQLVELERRPEDRELLNAIFRGFHTVKGGAAFFGLEPVVALCHAAEDTFNGLRSGKQTLNAAIMDVVLEAQDDLREMLEVVAVGGEPAPAKEHLVKQLREFADASSAVPETPPPPKPAAPAPAAPKSAIAAASADPFSDDEFEKLLDSIHGSGITPGAKPLIEPQAAAAAREVVENAAHHDKNGQSREAERAAQSNKATIELAAETTVRIDTARLDQVMNLVGELVLVRNRLKNHNGAPSAEFLRKSFAELDVVTAGLQMAIMQMRMQPIRKLFSRFPRLVRETARKLDKDINVEIEGDATELDKSLVEALNDPLVHMVRNAVDHGIEEPQVRVAMGKPAAGKICLSAAQASDHILITVRDDGAGMDAERLRRKALQKGLIDAHAAANLGHEESLQLVFMPGFSTKDQVSDISGRGVGMDVVRSSITALNGSVQIESAVGRGTAFHIRVPLTLAIQPVLMICLSERLFALPLQPVQDVFFLDETRVRRLDRWDAVLYRGETLRLVRMARWAGTEQSRSDHGAHVVIVRVGADKFGLIVSQVRGREEIVVKPLGRMLRGLAGIGGATVTGDGRVALIVDLGGLVAAYEQSL